jgi:hypothetical protein
MKGVEYMKPIIIRKPKFMRNDEAMWTYIQVANAIGKEACKPDITLDQQFSLLIKECKCLKKAAKAGGFRNMNDMYKWLKTHY